MLDEVREWQSRALDRMYPIVIFDALQVKIRDVDSQTVKNKAVYVALGVTRDGSLEVLGLLIAENDGAKFWLSVMNELKNRGVQDVLIAVVDGLKGFPGECPEACVSGTRKINHGQGQPIRNVSAARAFAGDARNPLAGRDARVARPPYRAGCRPAQQCRGAPPRQADPVDQGRARTGNVPATTL